ncbi:hypothetical protein CYG49_01835 [Candidatus Saccharibacteria bacterium]|nr:MAG: hypothetical protein CYG49_01835 [Candidatus Saccharibacteria bacterium]
MQRLLSFNKTHLLWAMVAAVILSMMSVTIQAQEKQQLETLTLSPSSQPFKVNAGETVTGKMNIINSGDVAYDFTVYARPYSVNDEKYEPNFTDEKPNADVYKWVQFDKTKYSLEPKETAEVTYTVNVPEGAAPGGHYGVVFAETKERELGTTGVARQKRVGQIIYMTVNGQVRTGGEIKGFVLPFWQTRPPVLSAARVANTGNVDFEAKVSTIARDIFGRAKFTYTGDPIVLPDTTRLVDMNWEKAPTFGLFKVEQKIEFLDQKHENSGWVLVAPRWFPLIFIVIIAAGVGYAVLQRRSNRR